MFEVLEYLIVILATATTASFAFYLGLQCGPVRDDLTGLPNRRIAYRLFRKYTRMNSTAWVAYLDLRQFKQLNDTYGHATGDFVLRQLTRRMKDAIGREGTACRWSGDEFVIIFPSTARTNREKIQQHLGKAVQAISQPLDVPFVGTITVTANAGLAPTNNRNWAEILSQAEAAMYAAKGADEAVVLYDPQQHSAVDPTGGIRPRSRQREDRPPAPAHNGVDEAHDPSSATMPAIPIRWTRTEQFQATVPLKEIALLANDNGALTAGCVESAPVGTFLAGLEAKCADQYTLSRTVTDVGWP